MKLVCISDTHGAHSFLNMPEGDILIHAGDFSTFGKFQELENFVKWMGSQPYRFKILISGNHDRMMELGNAQLVKKELENNEIIYLCDSGIEIDGVKFWGSPWTPKFYNWSFMKQRNSSQLKSIWKRIPKDINVLITHGPPYGILDKNDDGHSCGCELLHERSLELCPEVHIFGHIHESPGIIQGNVGAKISINASMLDGNYSNIRKPIVLEIKKIS